MNTTTSNFNSSTNSNSTSTSNKDFGFISKQFPNVTNFEQLKEEINKTSPDGDKCYNLSLKENDTLCLIYNNVQPKEVGASRDVNKEALEAQFKSYILEKDTLSVVGYQSSTVDYNEELENENVELFNLLNSVDWNTLIVQQSYEGTVLLVFYHNDSWQVSTRRCLNSDSSTWIKNISYKTMFDDAMTKSNISYNSLDKTVCYQFVLIHHLNKNIISYTAEFGQDYAQLLLIGATKRGCLDQLSLSVDGCINAKQYKFTSLVDMQEKLKEISTNNKLTSTVDTEGFLVKLKVGDEDTVETVRFQTEVYKNIVKIKPNNSNVHQSYLELYQTDKLIEYIRYFTKYNSEIIKRITISMKNLAQEMLNLYHCTRQKKNPDMYKLLGNSYKKLLFKLHGLYIKNRSTPVVDVEVEVKVEEALGVGVDETTVNSNRGANDSFNQLTLTKSVNVHDVYHCLKSLPTNDLRQLFFERMKLLKEDPRTTPFLNRQCMFTMTQSTLMFS